MDLQFSQDQPVRVSALNGAFDPVDARVKSFSGRFMSIVADVEIAPATPVRIEWDRFLVLAETDDATDRSAADDVVSLIVRHVLDRRDVDHFQAVWS